MKRAVTWNQAKVLVILKMLSSHIGHSPLRRPKFKYITEWRSKYLQGESLAGGPKLLSIKKYVIEIMTWKIEIMTWKIEIMTWKIEIMTWKIETMIWKIEIMTWKIEIMTWKIEIMTWKIETMTWKIEIMTWKIEMMTWKIEIMTWKFIYTYRGRCKTGPAHNRCWNWSPFTSEHTGMRFSKFWNTFPKVSTDGLNLLACSVFGLFDFVRGVFWYTLPFNRPPPPKERSLRALDRLPFVSNFLTNFWMQEFDGARLSPNSVRNAVWHALNEPVWQYLRTRNPALFDCIHRQ